MESLLRHDPIVVVTAKNKTRSYNYFRRRSKIYYDDASRRKVSLNDYSLTGAEKLLRETFAHLCDDDYCVCAYLCINSARRSFASTSLR